MTARPPAGDITERKRSERDLAQADRESDPFFGVALDPMLVADGEGQIVRVNPACQRSLGYTSQELTSRRFTDFVHPDDLQATLDAFAAQTAGGIVAGFENRYRCQDGSYRWLSWSATRVHDGHVYATARDVTERRRIDTEREQQLVLAQRAGGIGSWDWNVATGAIVWSATMEEMYGLAPGEFEGCYEHWARMTHPEDLPEAEAGLNQAVQTDSDWRHSFRILPADGEERWISALASPYLDDTGVCHVLGVNVDVTEQKRGERKLAEAARFFELSGDMICVSGFDGSLRQLNGRWEETLGWTPDELRSMPMSERIHPDDLAVTAGGLQRLRDGRGSTRVINRYSTKSAGWRWLEWNSTAVPEEGLIYASARDVTVRVQAEGAIRQAQVDAARARDEALQASAMKSAFLANMSHEVRTPLNGVIGMSDLLLDSALDREQREHVRLLKGSDQVGGSQR